MFDKETYIRRRAELKKLVGKGVILLPGNNEAPYNYPNNCYAPMRQDSTFVYYFGQHRDGLVGIIDIDNDEEWFFGNDIDVEDIVWMGFTPSVSDLAHEVGVQKTAPLSALRSVCSDAIAAKRTIHFLPPYRHDTMIMLMDLLDIHPSKQKEAASIPLIQAVVKMRSTKEAQEIEAIDRACDVGYAMHTTAQLLVRPGVTERFIAGQVDGIASSLANGNSFATIFSQHGEIMHGNPSDAKLEDGRVGSRGSALRETRLLLVVELTCSSAESINLSRIRHLNQWWQVILSFVTVVTYMFGMARKHISITVAEKP